MKSKSERAPRASSRASCRSRLAGRSWPVARRAAIYQKRLLCLLFAWTLAASHAHAADEETPALRAMDTATGHYVALCADLGADELRTSSRQLDALARSLAAVGATRGGGVDGDRIRALAREAAAALPAAGAELRAADARPRKSLFALSKPFVRYVGWFRAGGKRWKTYYCSMAKGSWLQPASDAKLANPYYGKKMLRCGDAVRTRGE